MNQLLISIVIPTFNRASFLEKTLYSIMMQTYSNVEILLVDDGSTDNTSEIVEYLKLSNKFFSQKLIYIKLDKNKGANAARNEGIRRAKGKYTAFLDSDDIWHPEKLEKQINRINEESEKNIGGKPIFCFTGRARVDEKYEIIALQFGGSMRNASKKMRKSNSIGTLSSILLDTWVAQIINGFNEELKACQDWDFYIRAMPFCHVIGVREPMIMYYDGDVERITRDHKKRLLSHLFMHRQYIKNHIKKSEKSEFYRNIAEDLDGLGKTRLASKFYAEYYWNKKKYLKSLFVRMRLLKANVRNERYSNYKKPPTDIVDNIKKEYEIVLA